MKSKDIRNFTSEAGHAETDPLLREGLRSSAVTQSRFASSPLPDFILTAFFLALTAALLVAINMRGQDISLALKDAATLTAQPVYLGAVSNAGVAFLIIAATATMMAAAAGAKNTRLFVFVSLFTGLLAADDLFLLHEGPIRDVLPWFEIFMFVFYGCAVLVILWTMRGTVFRPRQLPILLTLLCMSFSVIFDLFNGVFPGQAVAEDLCKFAAWLLWSTYWTRRSLEVVQVCPRRGVL